MMKKSVSIIIAAIMTAVMLMSMFTSCNKGSENKTEAKCYYVATNGNDSNDGSEGSPFATIIGARDAIRTLKSSSGLPDGGVIVNIAAGTYSINKSIEFTADDSGEAGKPIVYRAAEGAEVIIDGGVTLSASDFTSITDDIKVRLQTEDAKTNVVAIDLAAAGCYDLSDIEYVTGWISYTYRQELFIGGERMTVARYPNSGYSELDYTDVNAEDKTTTFYIDEEKAALWANAENIRIYGYPTYDWSSHMGTVKSVDPENASMTVNQYDKIYRYVKGDEYFIFNILEELDSPGEYYIDYSAGMMYLYPTDNFTDADISISQLADDMIKSENADYMTFSNLTLENGRNTGMVLKSDYVTVDSCVMRSIGCYGCILNGYSNVVKNCEIYNLGCGGISVTSGDNKTLTLSNSIIENNYIHDWSETYKVYNRGILAQGNGITIAHNELCNSPHEAIAISGGDMVVEYNEIYNVCNETADTGTIYTGRRWDWAGNYIRYNYIHDIVDQYSDRHEFFPGAIYLDDSISSQIIYGNIFVNINGYGIKCGGKYLTIENNIFINVTKAEMTLSTGQAAVGSANLDSYKTGWLWTTLLENDYTSDIWRYRVPQNLLMSEMAVSNTKANIDDPDTRSYIKIASNISVCNEKKTELYENDGSTLFAFGTFYDNVTYKTAEVGVVDAENGNYNLLEDSRVFRDILNFKALPFDEIGRK